MKIFKTAKELAAFTQNTLFSLQIKMERNQNGKIEWKKNLGLRSCKIILIILNGHCPNALIFIEIGIFNKIDLFDRQLDDEVSI